MRRALAAGMVLAGVFAGAVRADEWPQAKAEFENSNGLIIGFGESMQTWQGLREDAIRFEPAAKAACQWGSDSEIFCVFEPEAKAATRYHIHVPAGLRTQAGAALPALALTADTRRPHLRAQIASWQDGVPKIELYGDEGVTIAAAQAVLRAEIGGKPIPVRLNPLPPRGAWDRTPRFEWSLPASFPAETAIRLRVIPGLKSNAGALLGTQKEPLVDAVAAEPFRLRGGACAGEASAVLGKVEAGGLALACMPDEAIRLFFSRPLSERSVKAWATRWPAGVRYGNSGAEYGYRRSGDREPARQPGAWVELRMDAPRQEAVLPAPDEVRSADGKSAQSATIRLRTLDFRPALRAAHQRSLLREGDGSILAESVNAPPATLLMQGIGADAHRESFVTPSRPGNEPLPIVSPATERILAEGGWVSWSMPAAKPSQAPRMALQFAAPDFDLYAIGGRREVLAWANEWSGGPVRGAEVELLWLETAEAQPRAIARGRTGEDGVARIALPASFALPEKRNGAYPMWMLRAATGRRAASPRAVLPLNSPYDYGVALGGEARKALWGVADRPLYRAGDTVRYRLWQRDRTGGRLLRTERVAPMELRLAERYEDKPIKRWKATPGADGGLSGEIALPIHLPDAEYCIIEDEDYADEGVCFYVGTFRPQDLWAEAKTQDRMLRDGDRLSFSIESGYYSGGPAAGVPIQDVAAALESQDFAQAYPQFESFGFGESRFDPRVPLKRDEPLSLTTDGEGRAQGEITVAFDEEGAVKRPAFGRIRVTGEAKPSDREGTVAVPASARYARYARYVGLKMQPEWPQASSPIALEAVVADADGREVADVPVVVEVDYLASDGAGAPAQRLQVCTLQPRRAQPCDFPRAKTGRYRLTARSGEAGPAVLERYIWRIGDDDSETPLPRKLEVLGKPGRAGEPLRVVLSQKAEHGQALFVFSAGDRVLGHQLSPLRGRAQEFELATQPDWPQNVQLSAYVRSQSESNAGARRPANVDVLDIRIEWAPTEPVRDLALEFSSASAHPADTVRIVLRNDGRSPRKVTLAVIDDALLSLAAEQWRAFDPQEAWLVSRVSYGGALKTAGFLGWNDSPWRRWLAWDKPAIANDKAPACDQAKPAEAAACAAQAAADAAAASGIADLDGVVVAGNGAVNPIDISSVESTTLLTAEQIDRIPAARNSTSVALLAPGTTRGQPPPPPAPAPPAIVDEARATSLDSVMVVGSGAIDPSGIFNLARGRDDPPPAREQTRQALALARVRTRFADTALWLPEVTLAPGESRNIELALPDNLTRWRAVAWSSDADDDFEKAEATLATGLPVEARLQSPVRIFAGDRSRLAANVRQSGDVAVQAQVALRVDDGQGQRTLDHDQALSLQARGQSSFGAEIAPQTPGALIATAYAQTPAGRDAVAGRIDVASPIIEARKVQAGWLGRDPRELQLPALPAGADEPVLQLSLMRGDTGLIRGWTDGLRDYPHRCWEQILSRAVAASLALRRGDGEWPDAQAAVDEAIDNATVFQDPEGGFRFFVQEGERDFEQLAKPDPVLTAYSVRALKLLAELGHAADRDVVPRAQLFLEGVVDEKNRGKDDPYDDTQAAYALAAGIDDASAALDRAWRRWENLPLGAKISTTEALIAAERPEAAAAVERLLQKSQARGEARMLRAEPASSRLMSSSLREQCALIGLLREHPQLAPANALRSLRAGLLDLYAGGVDTADTQAAAICLMALRDQDEAGDPNPSMTATLGGERHTLSLAPGRDRDEWRAPLPPSRSLTLSAAQGEHPTAYLAQVIYREDARRASVDAVGFALQRRHEVLRDGRWLAVQGQRLQEGDWIRITLTLDNVAPRHFVAVTDSVPGGLRPTDLSLKGVAGPVLEKLSDPGSGAFATRKLDPASPRFYAERLPPGRHEIHYFARVGNTGDYLAAPAVAELMYGHASRARTAATRLRIEANEASPR